VGLSIALAVPALTGLLAGAAPGVVVFSGDSAFQRVFVVDEGPLRSLRFDDPDGDDQSVIDLRDEGAVPMEYLRVAAAALAFTEKPRRALVIGLGAGAFPRLLLRGSASLRVDAVDIDPLVAEVAARFFGLKADRRLAVHIEDGAAFVARARARYDFVLLDAYTGAGVPDHLATPAFFAAVARTLSPRGVVVANVALGSEKDELAIARTFARAFPSCVLLKGWDGGNLLLVASLSALPAPPEVPRALAAFDRRRALPFAVAREVHEVARCP
jgi:spermidine synthase